MDKPFPILVSIDSDEARRPRAVRLRKALAADGHFLLGKSKSLSHDLRFQREGLTLNVELKDFTGDRNSDYFASIINQEGHLYQQVLAGREIRDPLIIVILGGDAEVTSSIEKAVYSRGFRGLEAEEKITEYAKMIEDFEACCEGCNIRIWRLKADPFGRMLLRVRRILEGGDLSGFRPRPADGERKNVGLSLVIGNGIGPTRAQSILEKFSLTLEPKTPNTYLTDCSGIGPKLAVIVQESLSLPRAAAVRPKAKKAKQASQRRAQSRDAQA